MKRTIESSSNLVIFPEAELVRDFPFNPYLTIDPEVGAKVTHDTNIDDGVSANENDTRGNNNHHIIYLYKPIMRWRAGREWKML
ncbi:MAG: hypothetical protein MPL62_17780 [Alphaproteobacteria bacterium]|nr:hypothetical protein [Alphaproteobacteria bacterium]